MESHRNAFYVYICAKSSLHLSDSLHNPRFPQTEVRNYQCEIHTKGRPGSN